MKKNIYDIIVIGAGPTGLFSTFYASFLKLNTICVELSENIGGQLTNLYPNKFIYDFPGFQKIKGHDLIDSLKKQILNLKSEIITKTSINHFKYVDNEDYFELYDQNNNVYYAKFVIITVGIGSFTPNKIQNFPDSHEHDKVHYFLKSDCDYKDKNILVLGGGNSAVDIAEQLVTQYNSNVNLIHHKDELKAYSFTKDELISKGINIHLNTELVSWNPESCIFKNHENNSSELFYDFIIVQYGLQPLHSPIHDWSNLKIEAKKIIVDNNYETSIKNIFAAGDCIKNDKRINSIITGMSEATIIINNIKNIMKNKN